ncbi:MAG: cytochrome c oxidase assembly protein [Candidatus Dormibacteraceae bacterium]
MSVTWPFEPSVYIGLAGLMLGYGWLARDRLDNDRRPLWFLVGLVVLWLALETPIDTIGEEYLGSVHMIQHVLLGIVAPPLLLLGLSPAMATLLFKYVPGLSQLTRPLLAQLLAAAAWILWHLPPLYNLTTSHLQIHIGEHLMFIGVGLLLFWPVIENTAQTLAHPLSEGWKILYLGFATLPQDGVALPLQFGRSVFYAQYQSVPSLAPGYSPLIDQTLAGVFMMLGPNLVIGTILITLFFRWLRRSEQRQLELDECQPVAGA